METKELMALVKSKGLNIYQLLYMTKARMGLKKGDDFPDIVVRETCNIYLKVHAKIKNPFPYMLRVLTELWCQYNAEQNIQESKKAAAPMPVEMRNLIASIFKDKESNEDKM